MRPCAAGDSLPGKPHNVAIAAITGAVGQVGRAPLATAGRGWRGDRCRDAEARRLPARRRIMGALDSTEADRALRQTS